jgi:hypothetical protein
LRDGESVGVLELHQALLCKLVQSAKGLEISESQTEAALARLYSSCSALLAKAEAKTLFHHAETAREKAA